jgi:hypothetical protein
LVYGDRSDPAFTEAFNDRMDILAQETRAATLLINHDRKADAPTAEANGVRLYDVFCDATFDMSRTTAGLRRVTVEARYPVVEQFLLKREGVGDGELIVLVEDPEPARELRIRERVARGESIRQAAKAEGVGYSTARRIVQT